MEYILVDDISFYFNLADYTCSIDAAVLCVLLTYQIRGTRQACAQITRRMELMVYYRRTKSLGPTVLGASELWICLDASGAPIDGAEI